MKTVPIFSPNIEKRAIITQNRQIKSIPIRTPIISYATVAASQKKTTQVSPPLTTNVLFPKTKHQNYASLIGQLAQKQNQPQTEQKTIIPLRSIKTSQIQKNTPRIPQPSPQVQNTPRIRKIKLNPQVHTSHIVKPQNQFDILLIEDSDDDNSKCHSLKQETINTKPKHTTKPKNTTKSKNTKKPKKQHRRNKSVIPENETQNKNTQKPVKHSAAETMEAVLESMVNTVAQARDKNNKGPTSYYLSHGC